MATILTFISLLACSGAQRFIYPDQYDMMTSTTYPPYFLMSIPTRPPRIRNAIVARQPNAPTFQPPTSNLNFPVSYSANPQQEQVYAVQQTRFTGSLSPQLPYPSTQKPSTENPLQDWNDHVNSIIVRGMLKFSLDMEKQIYRTRNSALIGQRDNIVFSPISLAVTLSIVLAGSAGRTFEEVSKVLGLESGIDISRNSEVVHQMFGILLTQIHNRITGSLGPRVDFATAVFVQDGYPIRPEFKALSKNVYETEVINVDFASNGRAAQTLINSWVKQKTMNKITSILNDVPPAQTTLILLSALYFNGEWNQHFINGATKRKPFFIEENETIDVDMMYNGGPFPFYEDKQLRVKIMALPYKGHEISMYVVLPNDKGAKALRNFQNQLTVDIIENLIKNMKNETCIIGMPRMKLSSSLSLHSTLASLGLNSLFDASTSDLSLMTQGNSGNNRNPYSAPPRIPPITTPIPNRPRKSEPVTPPQSNNDVIIFPRFGEEENKTKPLHVLQRNYFTYEDKVRGLTVEQWATGFSIKRSRKARDTGSQAAKEKDSYTVDGSEGKKAKIVNLEENKYRFQDQRTKRQSQRPINQDFLNFVKQQNFSSYGLDDLRNSAHLVNPHLYATDVLHKVEIDISEKGTEAAAATAVFLERDGNQKRLVANRPFLFFIRHEASRLVLFWGTLNSPTPSFSAGT